MSGNNQKLIILAIGGNSLIVNASHQTVEDQFTTCSATCSHIVKLIEQGYRVVITHGNGPQVGFIYRRSELSSHELHHVPLDSCVADTQGAIGYHIQRAMFNCMLDWKKPIPVVTLVTQVLVDKDDPAFEEPSKPIGSFLDVSSAWERRIKDGWKLVEDAGRGYRRVVPSPRPQRILEIDSIRQLVEGGCVVVTVGGGGIPLVQKEDGLFYGAEAVIDKDLASSLLARELGADVLLISTAVEKACLNFGQPDEQTLDQITVAQAKQYIQQGQFAPGSMKPKIQSMVEFVEAGGKEALLTDPSNILPAVEGKTGTRIVP